jgi:hypothetical protein
MGAYSRNLALDRFTWEANYSSEYGIYSPAPDAASGEEVALVPNFAG